MTTVSFAVWHLLSRQSDISKFKGVGASLQLYEARNASKWFPKLEPSTALKDLYIDSSDGLPFIYVVDEDKPYVIVTSIKKRSASDVGEQTMGTILGAYVRGKMNALRLLTTFVQSSTILPCGMLWRRLHVVLRQ